MPGKHGCTGTTRKDTPCSAHPLKGRDVCISHASREVQESLGFGGSQPGAGRPPTPRAVDVLRERLEKNIDVVLEPLFDGLFANKGMTISLKGGGMEVVETPDHSTRIAAVRELLDRAYGKPKQATEITGADGGPVQVGSVDLSTLDADELIQLRELLSRAGPVA